MTIATHWYLLRRFILRPFMAHMAREIRFVRFPVSFSASDLLAVVMRWCRNHRVTPEAAYTDSICAAAVWSMI